MEARGGTSDPNEEEEKYEPVPVDESKYRLRAGLALGRLEPALDLVGLEAPELIYSRLEKQKSIEHTAHDRVLGGPREGREEVERIRPVYESCQEQLLTKHVRSAVG
jgi:hypothetical protein